MELLIRPLRRDDEPFLWDALYHAIHVPPGEPPLPLSIVVRPDLARYVAGWMQSSDDFGFVAEERGVPFGAAWLRRWSRGEKGYGFVNEATPELSMSLLPSYRGRGVGTVLLRCLLSAAEQRCSAVSLSVSASNPARRLYAREGFVPVSGMGGDSLTMVKEFRPLVRE